MAEYIDRDALLAEAKRISGPMTGDGWDNYGVYALINRQPAADVVERKKGRWIPVTERLPEEPGFYIVYTDSSYNPIRMLRYGMAAPVAFRDGNNWYDEKGQHIYSWLVKFWMPPPEPPKEETE